MFVPKFQLASDKYYRSILTPCYDRMKSALQAKVWEEDRPEVVSVCLDGWSTHHHGYLRVTCHYIQDLKRVQFCMASIPFNEFHAGQNIFKKLNSAVSEWNLKMLSTYA